MGCCRAVKAYAADPYPILKAVSNNVAKKRQFVLNNYIRNEHNVYYELASLTD